jgi:hypothetical protein
MHNAFHKRYFKIILKYYSCLLMIAEFTKKRNGISKMTFLVNTLDELGHVYQQMNLKWDMLIWKWSWKNFYLRSGMAKFKKMFVQDYVNAVCDVCGPWGRLKIKPPLHLKWHYVDWHQWSFPVSFWQLVIGKRVRKTYTHWMCNRFGLILIAE